MTEEERRELVATVAEAHTGLREATLSRLRRALAPNAPVLRAALRAEREAFRLKRELERFDRENLEPVQERVSLPGVRRGGKVVAMDRLRRPKGRHDQP